MIALKEARKKWEDELRAQMAENEREMKQIRLSSRQEKMQIDLLDTPELVHLTVYFLR